VNAIDPLWLKIVHVLSAALVLGGSIGIGFFMWNADRSRDAAIVAATGRIVMFAEALITAPAVGAEHPHGSQQPAPMAIDHAKAR
jgi:uncharacterized membrane protein